MLFVLLRAIAISIITAVVVFIAAIIIVAGQPFPFPQSHPILYYSYLFLIPICLIISNLLGYKKESWVLVLPATLLFSGLYFFTSIKDTYRMMLANYYVAHDKIPQADAVLEALAIDQIVQGKALLDKSGAVPEAAKEALIGTIYGGTLFFIQDKHGEHINRPYECAFVKQSALHLNKAVKLYTQEKNQQKLGFLLEQLDTLKSISSTRQCKI